jgi:hypothetical protein
MINNIIIIIIIVLLLLTFVNNINEHFTQRTNDAEQNIKNLYNINNMFVPNAEINNIYARNINAETINNINNNITNIQSKDININNMNIRSINNISIDNNKWTQIKSKNNSKCWKASINNITTNNNCDNSDDNLFTLENEKIRSKKYPNKCLRINDTTISLNNCVDDKYTTWLYIVPGNFYNPISQKILKDNGSNLEGAVLWASNPYAEPRESSGGGFFPVIPAVIAPKNYSTQGDQIFYKVKNSNEI